MGRKEIVNSRQKKGHQNDALVNIDRLDDQNHELKNSLTLATACGFVNLSAVPSVIFLFLKC